MKKAIIIVPTYNEHENITKLIPTLLDIFRDIKTWDMHILVVDDSSPDKTYEVVEAFAQKNKHVHLLLNKQKSGLGGAYLKGMDHAFNQLGADVVFEFDADFSHDPSRIPAFLTKLDAGYDMVLGSRYIPGGGIPANWGPHRKFLSVVGNIIIMLVLTDFRIRDWTGGYRALTREVYDAVHNELKSERFTGYTFQIGFLYNAVRRNFKITEVPFQFVDRTVGKSKMGPEYIKNTLLYIFRVRLQEILNHRIFKFAVVGGVGATVQLATLSPWQLLFPFQIAFFLSMETAILSNFALNNLWTFADRKLQLNQLPAKFVQFNIASAGSIVIQQIIAIIGEFVFGLHPLFTVPVLNMHVGTGHVYAVLGIAIGMFWNFFAYNKFIWSHKQTKA